MSLRFEKSRVQTFLSYLQFIVYLLFLDLGESLAGRIDLGTNSQVIFFRARYSLSFRPISNCQEQANGSKSRKEKIARNERQER